MHIVNDTLQMFLLVAWLLVPPIPIVVVTKVEYVLMNVDATSMLSSVNTRDMVDLNTSDHLSIVVEFKGADCGLEGKERSNLALKVVGKEEGHLRATVMK